MPIHVVQLGSPRKKGEGLRLGTVRRPPRGVPKTEWAKRDYFDVWLPNLAPSAELIREARANGEPIRVWGPRYRAEMRIPEAAHLLEALAQLSHQTTFSVGCYCEDESRCHRSLLRALLKARGAKLA